MWQKYFALQDILNLLRFLQHVRNYFASTKQCYMR
jgi:hypothetical protein